VLKTLVLIIALITLAGCSSNGIESIDSNQEAADLKVGQVYKTDFTIDSDYMNSFVAVSMLKNVSVIGSTVNYTKSQDADFTQYFAWVCYPKITKLSQATVLFMEDVGGSPSNAGSYTIKAIVRMDTTEAISKFGGTYSTRQNGW
jgi:hypothetical protein